MSDRIGYCFDPDSFQEHFEGSDIESVVNDFTHEQLLQAQAIVHSNDMLYDMFSTVMVDAAFLVMTQEQNNQAF